MLIMLATCLAHSSCVLFLADSSNFGDINKLKRVMLDETWNIHSLHAYSGERPDRNTPYTTTRDTVVATSGTMQFEKDSERGVRAMTYTDALGDVYEASFILDADVNDDNPVISFVDLDSLFPAPYFGSEKYDVVSFSDTEIEFFMPFNGTGDRTRHEFTIILTK